MEPVKALSKVKHSLTRTMEQLQLSSYSGRVLKATQDTAAPGQTFLNLQAKLGTTPCELGCKMGTKE